SDTSNADSLRQAKALEKLSRIKISGYIQAQFQFADSAGQQSFNGGNFPAGVDKRFTVRRGRLKVQYDGKPISKGWSITQYVLQIDATEKGLALKDAYVKLTDPWVGWLSLTTGMQNRPFGYEIPFSSSTRESPERGRMSQIIFPGERDLGMM
ncbi:MAG TPA: porin, partial [Bacteroidia bacterium]|nr:porin [Bacteroidia bacterium]